MFRKLSIAPTFRSSGSSSKVKYCRNRGVLRKGRRLKGVLKDDDEDEDEMEEDELDSFNGVRVIGGTHSGVGSQSTPINVVKMGHSQVTYGNKGSAFPGGHGPSSGKKSDQERNGPRVVPGIITSAGRGNEKVARVFSHSQATDKNKGTKIESKESEEDDEKMDTKPIITTISGNANVRKDEEESEYLSCKRHEMRRKEIKKDLEKWDDKTSGYIKRKGIFKNWSFIFDPSGRLCYYWSMIVSFAFLYNFWVIIYRFAFSEINSETMVLWLTFDVISDAIYIFDIIINFRICYLEEGVLQTNAKKLRQYYMNSTFFYIDCLCLLPLDFLYLSIGFNSILRSFRLVKIYKYWSFLDRTERHTNYPNVVRTISLVHYILVIFHWNACLYHLLSKKKIFGSSDWFPGARDHQLCSDVECDYLHSFYWSVLALTTIGDLPRPRTKSEYIFLIVELFLGLFLLATVLGHVANIVTNVSAARKEFQAKLDAVKTYMRMRRVPEHLKLKVIRWFDYLWMTQKSSDEDKSVGFLPGSVNVKTR